MAKRQGDVDLGTRNSLLTGLWWIVYGGHGLRKSDMNLSGVQFCMCEVIYDCLQTVYSRHGIAPAVRLFELPRSDMEHSEYGRSAFLYA